MLGLVVSHPGQSGARDEPRRYNMSLVVTAAPLLFPPSFFFFFFFFFVFFFSFFFFSFYFLFLFILFCLCLLVLLPLSSFTVKAGCHRA